MSQDKSIDNLPQRPEPPTSRAIPRPEPNRRRVRRAAADQEFSLRFLTSVFGQWWKVLIPVTLLLVSLSVAAIIVFFKPVYHAAAWLQIQAIQPFVAFPDRESAEREDTDKFVNTQVELLRSPLVLGRALSQPEIAGMPELADRRDPVEWLSTKGLLIVPRGDSEILEIAFEGKDPDSSARLVNAVIDAYFSLRQEKRGEQTQSIIKLLEDEQLRRADEIKMLQTEIRQLQQQVAAKDPSLSATAFHGRDVIISDNPLKSVQQNLDQAQIDHKILEAQVIAMEESLEEPTLVPEVLIDRDIDARPEIQEALAQLVQKQALLEQMKTGLVAGTESPKYQRLLAEIEQLQANLTSLRQANRPRIQREMEALSTFERRRELEELRTQLETQKLVVQSMRSNYESLVRDISETGGQTLDLRLKQDELNRKQDVFNRISERAAELATERYAPARVELIQPASPPKMPVEEIPWKYLAVALLLSTSLPFGLCALWEKSVRRVTSADQLQMEASLPVVGEIARLPVRPTVGADTNGDHGSYQLGLFEESIDSLRTGLILAHDEEKIQVLAVSSAVSGEGKSSVASQLAVSLARSSGLPTLLIDGDMRNPDLHHIFDIDLQPGLADVLGGTTSLDPAINRQWSQHVHILPAGKLGKSPHKLLGSHRFQKLLEHLRRRYRYIIIDTPPVLAASESLVMAREADGTLVCAMRDVSREGHVKMTYDRLVAVGALPIGTVLNGVPTKQYARRYGNYAYTK